MRAETVQKTDNQPPKTFSAADIGLILKAAHFAANKHRSQKRKGGEASPYINHPLEVADLIWNTGECYDPEVVCAAILHDTVEDTETTFTEIEELFGMRIASLVKEVTDDKSLPKAERKALQIKHAPHLSEGACLIKLGDKASNVKDIVNDPPPDWSEERKHDYVEWTKLVVNELAQVSLPLKEHYERNYQSAKATLAKQAKKIGD